MDASEARDDKRPELRVVAQADEHFQPVHHLLDQEPVELRTRFRLPQPPLHPVGRPDDGAGVAEPERDAADFGLVDGLARDDLERHRIPDVVGKPGRFGGGCGEAAPRFRDTSGGEQIRDRSRERGCRAARRRHAPPPAFGIASERLQGAHRLRKPLEERHAGRRLERAPRIGDVLTHAPVRDHRGRAPARGGERFRVAALVASRRELALHRKDIDAGVLRDRLADFLEVLRPAGQPGAAVERVGRRQPPIQKRRDRGFRLPAQLRDGKTGLAGVIEEQAGRPARIARERHARSPGEPHGRKHQGGLDQVVEAVTAHDAVAFADRVENVVVAGHGTGMALGRRTAALARPGLDDHDGLCRGKRLVGGRHEGFGAANSLQHAGDDPGLRVVDQEGDVVGDVEIELVAAGHRIAEAETPDGALSEPVLKGSPGLEDHADAALWQRAHPFRGVEQMGLGQGERAHAVGSADPEPLFAEFRKRPGARAARFVAPFAESRGEDQRGLEPVGVPLGERVDHVLGRDDGEGEVDGFGQAREGRVYVAIPQAVAPRIDQIDRDREAGMREVAEDRARPAAGSALRSAHDGNGPRPEKLLD